MEYLGGIRRRWEEVRGRECRRKEEVPRDQYKGQKANSNLIVICHNYEEVLEEG